MTEIEVQETVWIPMPDGTRLAARLWLPASARSSPVPCILEYIPYRRRDRTRIRDESMHPHFAAAGYAAIRVDIRGYGDSEGSPRTNTRTRKSRTAMT
jgi:predicted acyl esterase